MTKATEIKLEDYREDAKDGTRDRRRGMKLVPGIKSVRNGRSFNIGVAENMFSPRVALVDRSALTSSDESRSSNKNHGNPDSQIPETLRIVATVGVFIVGCTLGFLIGRRRD